LEKIEAPRIGNTDRDRKFAAVAGRFVHGTDIRGAERLSESSCDV
jgi:hypothetical protein